jgi:YspA, cpYpsA-related SLOG family
MLRRPVRILVTGSRTWTDKVAIAQAISDSLHSMRTSIGGAWPLPVVVHGGARGADQLADAIARGWGWAPECHPADWARYGRAAGYRRNAHMVALGADVCLAFILDGSAGASHTAELAEAAGIPTRRYHHTSSHIVYEQ